MATLQENITIIQDTLDDIHDAIIAKGGTVSGTDITSYASGINGLNIPMGIPREVSAQGVYGIPTSFTFSLPSNATSLSAYVFYYTFNQNTTLVSADLSSLTTINQNSSLCRTFNNCTNLTSIDLSGLTTINAQSGISYMCNGCTSLTSIDLSNLTSIKGYYVGNHAFDNCSSLVNIDLSSLTTLGSDGLNSAFANCTNLTSVDLSSLNSIGSSGLKEAFTKCTKLKTLSFPSLTSTSFGSSTNQFNKMLGFFVNKCTVHFPRNLRSVIGSWSDVTAGFGGSSTTVLFDLPATT